MRRIALCGTLALVAWTGSLALAQTQKLNTPEDYDKAMNALGKANGTMNKAPQSAAYADAKVQIPAIRDIITSTKRRSGPATRRTTP